MEEQENSIEDSSTYAEEANNAWEAEMCQMCHQRRRDTSENPESQLCSECREKAIHYPIPKWLIAAFVMVIVLTIVAAVQMPASLKGYKAYANAERDIENGELYNTLANLESVLAEHPNTTKIAVKLTNLAMKYDCYDYAAYVINNYLVGKSVSDLEYSKINEYSERLDAYYDTADDFMAWGEQISNETADGEFYSQALKQIDSMLEAPGYDQVLLYYYRSIYEMDRTAAAQDLENCLAMDPMFFPARADYAVLVRYQGDFRQAREEYGKILKYEKSYVQALRGMAIIEMLEKNMEQGLTYAEAAYNANAEDTYVRETYMIALALSGQEQEAEKIGKEIESAEGTIQEDTKALLAGKVTLEEYYTAAGEGAL